MSKTKKIVIGFILAVAVIAAGWYLIDSLFRFGIIPQPYVPKYLDLSEDELGSAVFLDGKTAIVSVFASDAANKWDLSREEDKELREKMLSCFPIACDWLTEQGKKYGRSPEFVYASDENDELLYYETEFTEQELLENYVFKEIYHIATAEWDYIKENIDSDRICETYGCKNIVYYFFLNTPEDYEYRACALPTMRVPMAEKYELVWIPSYYCCPSVVAHEMIHLFGAPDLYGDDGYDVSYGMGWGFEDFCYEKFPTDIMLSTFDAETGKMLEDRITREITDITAYYIGWLDEAPFDVDENRMWHSQFDKKKQ